MHVVVVESPAKAKTINKYLGKDYEVLASFGHVRDLPAKNGSVKPDEDFAMTYEVDDDAKKHVNAIAKAVKGADTLYLATDPDREGEAISWHILEALKASKQLPKNTQVHRIAFDEITKKAVIHAIEHPRDIDMALVNAQQARRALDYLVGFTLSPVLWRKLPGSKSAGRVQSVALRLICERDAEIEAFVAREYWDIKAQMLSSGGSTVIARLTHYNGKKLDKFDINKEAQAKEIVAALQQKQYKVETLEPKQVRRNPAPPFTTSTLQQEAARKLGFGAKHTMQIAQKLYEEGIITYMRTDSVSISQDALGATRAHIESSYGANYLPEKPRFYANKSKNAQEAHEAIRPTEIGSAPRSSGLSGEQLSLYELIWKRTVASQMESAVFDQMGVDIAANDNQATFRATGSVMRFDGFLKLYQEGRDDEEDEASQALPTLELNEAMQAKEITPEQHFTEPPPRYSEASLVKKLEELGIGRPSTYASIISVLQDRGYVRLEKKRFIAESLGRVVSAFLVNFFEKYVQYDFTADLENQLDDVAEGERDWKEVLRAFWKDFIAKIDESKKLSIDEVLIAVGGALDAFLFKPTPTGKDPRACPSCETGKLGLKLGKFGAYIACANYPDCTYKHQIATGGEGAEGGAAFATKTLGIDPATNMNITLRKGPYGMYVQLGEEKKPKRASLPKGMTADAMTLEAAISLLALPREVGLHPETQKPIMAGLGRFGPYLLHDGKYTSIPKDDDILTIGINRAVDVIATKAAKGASGRGAASALEQLGKHPDDEKPVAVYNGKYGPYVKWNKINATLPKDKAPEEFTLEEAVELLAKKKKSKK